MSSKVSSVFLNVPFDTGYEDYFLALITTVVAVGRTPRSVLELPEHGMGRLTRLLQRIGECDLSIHDLSRVGLPARFNMPFELGLACAVAAEGKHAYILLERQQHRLDRTLSDIKGRDPYIYGKSIRRLVACLLDALQVEGGQSPDSELVFRLSRAMKGFAEQEKKRRSSGSIFTRSLFRELVAGATALAAEARLIRA